MRGSGGGRGSGPEGWCDARFTPVRDVFAGLLASGAETGAALAAFVEGRLVVDLWGGDDGEGRPWRQDTLVHTWSVTKPFAAAAVLRLVEAGQLGLDDPVARHWPEFAAAGKETTTLRHLLSHQAGLPAFDAPQPLDVLLDPARGAALLAAQPPAWPPGTAHGEHALTYGLLLGELVRRVDGRTLGRVLAAEVCVPLGLDFAVGLDAAAQARCARITPWKVAVPDWPALVNPPGALDPSVVNSPAWRAAEVAAVNGHGTARAVAGFYSGLLTGTSALSPATVAELTAVQCSGPDRVLGRDVAWGLGPQLDEHEFGHGGIGGSWGGANTAHGYAMGYLTRRMADHDRVEAVERVLACCLT